MRLGKVVGTKRNRDLVAVSARTFCAIGRQQFADFLDGQFAVGTGGARP